jgi:hypothetical protein
MVGLFGWFIVFNATFNNISVFTWLSIFLLEKTGIPGENRSLTLYHIMLYRVHLAWTGFELTTLLTICTDCISSYKSNYHMITTTTAPFCNEEYTPTRFFLKKSTVRTGKAPEKCIKLWDLYITTGIALYIILVINCTYKNCNLCNPLKTVVSKCFILLPAKFL